MLQKRPYLRICYKMYWVLERIQVVRVLLNMTQIAIHKEPKWIINKNVSLIILIVIFKYKILQVNCGNIPKHNLLHTVNKGQIPTGT